MGNRRWCRCRARSSIAAAAGHGLLYLLILAQPVTGWLMSSAADYPVSFFGLFEFPILVGENHDLHETLEDVHEALFERAGGHRRAARARGRSTTTPG